MNVLLAAGRADLRNVSRDSLLASLLLLPWLMVPVLRLLVPAARSWLLTHQGFDLAPYGVLIVSLIVLLNVPLLFGALTGFLLLDERDEGTLTAIRVTPTSAEGLLLLRLGAGYVATVLYVIVIAGISGLLPPSVLPALIPIALVAALFGPVVALYLAAFARNKLEGLALAKAFGLLLAAPGVAFFVGPRWELAFGLIPTYWPVKALWLAAEGEPFVRAAAVGGLYYVILAALLFARFARRW